MTIKLSIMRSVVRFTERLTIEATSVPDTGLLDKGQLDIGELDTGDAAPDSATPADTLPFPYLAFVIPQLEMAALRSATSEIFKDVEPSLDLHVHMTDDLLWRGRLLVPRTLQPPRYRPTLIPDNAGVPVAGGPS